MPDVRMTENWLEDIYRKTRPAKRIDWKDAGQILPGVALVLRVGARYCTWQLRYVAPSGRHRRLPLGHYPFLGLEEARAKHREAASKLAEGIDPQVQRQVRSTIPSFAAALSAFLDHQRSPSPKNPDQPRVKSWREYGRVLGGVKVHTKNGEATLEITGGRYTPAEWLHLRIDRIDARDVRAASRAVLRNSGDTTANRWQRYLSSMLSFAVAEGWLDANPVLHLNLPGEESTDTRALDWQEIVRVWNAAREHPGIPGQIVRALLLFGQRPTMTLQTPWSEIEDEAGEIGAWWRPPAARMKDSARSHVIYVGHPLAQAFLGELKRGEYLFPVTGGQPYATHRSLTKPVQQIRKASGVDAWSAKTMRTTVATRMLELDVQPSDVSTALHHSLKEVGAAQVTLVHYGSSAEMRAAVQRAFEVWHGKLHEVLK